MIIYTTDHHPISTQRIYSVGVNSAEKRGSPNLNNSNTACDFTVLKSDTRKQPKY